MAKILVAGGAGFIGSWIANRLHELKHDVFVVDDESGGTRDNLNPDIPFHLRDLRNIEEIGWVFKYAPVDVIYYLAANAGEGASFFQPVSVVTRNTLAYANTLMLAIRYGVKKIILFSSIAVYGDQPPPFFEDMPYLPIDIHGLQKVAMERMTVMLSGSHGIDYTIIRPHNEFGENQCLSDIHRNVIAIWMNKIMRGEPIAIYGDGEQIRAFSYIKNTLPSYIQAMGVSHATFNIGGDYPIKIIDAAKIVASEMGTPDHPVVHLPDRHSEAPYVWADHTLAKSVLGLEETDEASFIAGVKAMAHWARARGPQEWRTTDELEIPNKKTPEMWLDKSSSPSTI